MIPFVPLFFYPKKNYNKPIHIHEKPGLPDDDAGRADPCPVSDRNRNPR